MEALSRQIEIKISILRALGDESVHLELDDVEDTHIAKTAFLFATMDDLEGQDAYLRVLSEIGTVDKMNVIFEKIKSKGQGSRMYQTLINRYESTTQYDVEGHIRGSDYTNCPTCGVELINDYDNAELQCNKCGFVCHLVGTIYGDNCSIVQEKIKTRSGVFNPNRHFQFWWQHILAKEPEEELSIFTSQDDPHNQHGEKLIVKLRELIKRDRKILRRLTVNDVRKMLKELGSHCTKLNKNVPLIMKKLTGIGPPSVTDEFSQKVEKLFNKAIEIGEKKRRKGRINRNYYPFYIYKIVDAISPPDDHETRRILYYIYLQSDPTIIKDDADWEDICKELQEIKFSVTKKLDFLKYRPE